MVTLEKAWDNANDLSVYIKTLEEKKEKSQLKISKGRKNNKKEKKKQEENHWKEVNYQCKNKSRDTTTDYRNIKRTIKEFYKQLYGNQFNSLGETDKIFKIPKLLTLKQEKIKIWINWYL